MVREICFDTETTGLDVKAGDRLVEIGCVEMIDGNRTGNDYHCYINPQKIMSEEVIAVHGLTNDMLKDCPVFKEVAQEFLKYVGEDSILIAHNASFDIKFINYELEQAGFTPIALTRFVDTLAIAKKMFPGAGNSLDNLCNRFNIDLSKRSAHHGALLDAELLSDVYIELTGGKQISIFAGEAHSQTTEMTVLTEQLLDLQTVLAHKTARPARAFPISETELAQHLAFINKNMPNSLWYATSHEAEN